MNLHFVEKSHAWHCYDKESSENSEKSALFLGEKNICSESASCINDF